MNSTPVVSLQDLEVIFKSKQGFIDQYILRKKKLVHAVDGLSLDIYPGEIVSLVGESGSGKTTTNRASHPAAHPRHIGRSAL
ncbi:MAG: ATP-binding cassette domain-containing protein [Tissierellia bacterium]|nr:ATP-binding cassette domain-containing protein [Tissierellia bacterium]